MIELYKKIDGKMEFVDYGIPRLRKSYEKRGYTVGETIGLKDGVAVVEREVVCKGTNYNPIHHIHRARFGLRERINGLICKLIPKRFLSY